MTDTNAITKLEQDIFDKEKDDLIVLVTHFNGLEMKGIFSDINHAKKFAIRYCINHITLNYNKHHTLKSYEYKQKYDSIYKFLEFEFLHATHLSKDVPIYILHSDDYKIYGKPIDYLTNDKDSWLYRMQKTMHDNTYDSCVCAIDQELDLIFNIDTKN